MPPKVKSYPELRSQRLIDDIDMLKNTILTIISNLKDSNELNQLYYKKNTDALNEIASIAQKQGQHIINTNHKIKMIMQYLNVDYKDVVDKYDSSKENKDA